MGLTKEEMERRLHAEYIRGYLDATALAEQAIRERNTEKVLELTSNEFVAWCDYHSSCDSCPYNDYDGACENKFVEDYKNGTVPNK